MKKNIIIAAVLLIAFSSCSPTYYVPNTQNVSLISEKGETSLTLAGNGNQVEFQGAMGVSNSIAIKANGGWFIPSDLDNGNGGSGRFAELGAGYFKDLGSNFVFETYGIVGFGSFENHMPSTTADYPATKGDISGNIIRYGIQPNFGYKTPNFSAAISTRLVNLNYSNVSGDLIFENQDQVNYLNTNNSNFLFEPAFTVRAGVEKVKLQLQYLHSFNLSTDDFRQANSTLTVGLNFNFH